MRAMKLHGPRDLRMHDEPVPQPGHGEVLIQIKSVGVCASDVHSYKDAGGGKTGIMMEPLTIGHEPSGQIAALGEGVTGLAVGDKVAIEPANPCMQCEQCEQGHYNVCPNVKFFGDPPTNGSLCDYIAHPARLAIKVPDSFTFDDAAMIEPLAVGAYTVELGEPAQDDVAVILGAGAIGLSTLQAIRIAGVKKTIVVEPIETRRNVALKLGASEVVDSSSSDGAGEIKRLTGGRGADIIFECSGNDDAVRQACGMVKIRGKIVVVGMPDADDYMFVGTSARRKEIRAVFVRRSNETTERSIHWVAEGKADVSCYPTHHFPLERAAEAIELAAKRSDGVVRAVVVVNA